VATGHHRGFFAVSNLALTAVSRRAVSPATLAGAALLLDCCCTALLAMSGGPSNPFTIFYLVLVVPCCLAYDAALVDHHRRDVLGGLCQPVCLLLAFAPSPRRHMHGGNAFSAHLNGMWLAYAVTSGMLGGLVYRVSERARRSEN